jgi:hypothetical protein
MKKLVFSFLVDFGYQKSVMQSIPLVKSIRKLGGSLKNSDILICYVGELTTDYLMKLSEFDGILTKQVDQFHQNHKHSNKLRIVEQEEIFEYEYLCLLDCDTIVLGDIKDQLIKETLVMKIADGKTVSSGTMKLIFKEDKIEYPKEIYRTTLDQPTIAYCNNGVLICDTINRDFFKIWIDKTKWLCNNQNLLGHSSFFTEQASLSLAIYHSKIKFKELPIEYNFPTHIGLPMNDEIKIIHYHDQMIGGVLNTPYQKINRKLNMKKRGCIDIVIVSWARDEALRQVTLDGINSLTENANGMIYHIYVVESNKDVNYDEYKQWKWMHSVTTIHPDVPFGYHKYLNIGRRAGKSKYVALCNSDLTFEKGWASSIIEVMEAHPDIKSASPWCPQTQGDNTPHKDKVYVGHRVRGEVAGWCIFQQRDIYEQIGELNEGVDFWFSDNIYANELQMRGIKHGLVCNSVVNHHDGNLGKTGNTAIDESTRQSYTMGQQAQYQQALLKLKDKLGIIETEGPR